VCHGHIEEEGLRRLLPAGDGVERGVLLDEAAVSVSVSVEIDRKEG